ncbi:MAG: hypothetical protein JW704_00675 [Anaerolineaceae bacterium]|nr:hypothetical protein [Anaerolineaceae bacterium]
MEDYCQQKVDFLLIGKSFGAVRTWWLLQEYWFRINRILNEEHRIGVVLIDPHGWVVGDGRAASYGMNEPKLPWHEEWGRSGIRLKCLYQRNEYPRGAFLGAPNGVLGNNVLLEGDADHYNVLDIDTETGLIVAESVRDMIQWLGGHQ